MATVEKTPAIDPKVLADLEAVCNTKGIVRDPKLLRGSPSERTRCGRRLLSNLASRRSVRKSFVRCTTRNEIRYRCIDGIPMGGSRA